MVERLLPSSPASQNQLQGQRNSARSSGIGSPAGPLDEDLLHHANQLVDLGVRVPHQLGHMVESVGKSAAVDQIKGSPGGCLGKDILPTDVTMTQWLPTNKEVHLIVCHPTFIESYV